ncbi:MAG: penicillin acylase family protein [Candidatus Lokiarchaeia archaeon]
MQKKKLVACSIAALFVSLILVTGVSVVMSTSGLNGFSSVLAVQENAANLIQSKQTGRNVTIIWDIYGIPHINGTTQADTFFGHGYAQAVDGIELLMLNLITAKGRLSLTFGYDNYNNTWNPGYKFNAQFLSNAESDGLLWQLKIPVSHSEYLKINQTMRELMIEPFAAGINSYIIENWATLPTWIKQNAPVTGEDIASMAALVNFLFAEDIGSWLTAEGTLDYLGWDVATYLQQHYLGAVPMPPSVGFSGLLNKGSNEYIVNGSLSDTGYPILGADPHLEWDGITQWHEAHLMAPAQGTLPELNIYGVIFYGLPFIGIGHNEYLSWMSTVNQPDLMDVWIERLDPTNTKYYYNGSWVPLIKEVIKLPVLVPGIGVLVQELPTYYSHHGVLLTINETAHYALAVNYSTSGQWKGMEQFYLMNTAQNITQWKEAMSMLGVAMFNYMVATKYNETYYVWNAMCPQRNDMWNWNLGVPGWNTTTDWGAFIPFSDLPTQEDPESGWMQNCNIECWNITTQPNNITTTNASTPFPRYLVNHYTYLPGDGYYQAMSKYSRGYNMFYILNGLAAGGPDSVSADDFLGIAGNSSVYYLATDYIDMLPANVPGTGNETLNETVVLLKKWDKYATNQTAMTVFKLWAQNTNQNPPTNQSYALSTLNATVNWMVSKYGNATGVYWGNVHIVVRGSTIQGLNGTSGDPYGCLNPHYGSFDSTIGYWYCYGGESFEMVTTWIDGNVTSWSCLPYGNTNNQSSPHYDDMLLNWYSKDKLHPDFFYTSDILANNETIVEIPVYSYGQTLLWFLQYLFNFYNLILIGEAIVSQQTASSLMLGGIAVLVLIICVAAVVIVARRP